MRTVLIVDDDEDDIEIVKEALLKIDDSISLLHAYTGPEALDKLETVDPDIILLDINMPLMTGIECLHEIRQRYPKLSASVTVLSTAQNNDHKLAAQSLNARYYCKPNSFSELVNLLTELIY